MPRPAVLTGNVACQVFHKADLAVFPPSAFAHGNGRKTLPLHPLPQGRDHLHLLRSRPTLLHPSVCDAGSTHRRPCCRLPLSSQPTRSSRPRRAPAPLPGETPRSDASGFPTRRPFGSTLDSTDSAGESGALALLPMPSPLARLGTPGLPALSDSPKPF